MTVGSCEHHRLSARCSGQAGCPRLITQSVQCSAVVLKPFSLAGEAGAAVPGQCQPAGRKDSLGGSFSWSLQEASAAH